MFNISANRLREFTSFLHRGKKYPRNKKYSYSMGTNNIFAYCYHTNVKCFSRENTHFLKALAFSCESNLVATISLGIYMVVIRDFVIARRFLLPQLTCFRVRVFTLQITSRLLFSAVFIITLALFRSLSKHEITHALSKVRAAKHVSS